jgi:hypothetical protein
VLLLTGCSKVHAAAGLVLVLHFSIQLCCLPAGRCNGAAGQRDYAEEDLPGAGRAAVALQEAEPRAAAAEGVSASGVTQSKQKAGYSSMTSE